VGVITAANVAARTPDTKSLDMDASEASPKDVA
jgi:hypothetical protein